VTHAEDFIRAHTTLSHAPLVPEIVLHLASEITPLWQATEDWLAARDLAPPFWAFAWPGSQALARYILDNPMSVAGRRVLDFASGCGIAATAAALAGAASVEAADVNPLATAATRLNAAVNNVVVTAETIDPVGSDCKWEIILCGDVCYERPMTPHILPWLSDMARCATVWVADPGRAYLPTGLQAFRHYHVATSCELEDQPERLVVLYTLPAAELFHTRLTPCGCILGPLGSQPGLLDIGLESSDTHIIVSKRQRFRCAISPSLLAAAAPSSSRTCSSLKPGPSITA
jgi:predicted nicotinamide N-methyase